MNLISHNILFPALVKDASHPYYDECCGLLSGGGLVIREIQAELVWVYFGSVTSGGTDVRSRAVIESFLRTKLIALPF